MRFLAIDLGDRRTGLALGDGQTGIVTPLAVVEAPIAEREGAALLEALARAASEQLGDGAGEVVLGLPVNMDGTEGRRAAMVRRFGSRIAAHLGRSVHYQDERLTSSEAEWSLARSGLTHKQKKERRDALAAAAILRDFLAARGGASGPASA